MAGSTEREGSVRSCHRCELKDWATAVLRKVGARGLAAERTSECLVAATERGVSSHGIRLLPLYVKRLEEGWINGDVNPHVERQRGSVALLNGNGGLGPHVGIEGITLAVELAKNSGVGVVGVKNSTHLGALCVYSEIAAVAGCVGVALSNTGPAVAVPGGVRPILGTNPIAIAVPGLSHNVAMSLDMATSVVAQGRVMEAEQKGDRLPPGWAIGPDGDDTLDPTTALAGALLPMAGYKGYGLALMIEVLAACWTGASISSRVEEERGLGHFFLALEVSSVRTRKAFASALAELVDEVRRSGNGHEVLLPGERETRHAASLHGILTLDAETAAELLRLAERFSSTFPRDIDMPCSTTT